MILLGTAEPYQGYLERRGYAREQILSENLKIISGGTHVIHGMSITATTPIFLWEVRSMSGQLIGFQTRETETHTYRWHQAPGAQHLPILYAQPEDYAIMYETEELFLTEGCFDRIAIKRIFPDKAVGARLSKGASNQLAYFINRYVKKLWLCFDNDEAGKTATEKAEKRFEGITTIRLSFPLKDPSSFLEHFGPKKAREILQTQMEQLAWL